MAKSTSIKQTSLKPKQLMLMFTPETKRVCIVANKPQGKVAIKDVTVDYALMHAAEIKLSGGTGLEWEMEARDEDGNNFTLLMRCDLIDSNKELDEACAVKLEALQLISPDQGG